MEKRMIAFYGNNSVANDIAVYVAITMARMGGNISYVELSEDNAHTCFQFGAEEQRVKTIDYYMLNHKKKYHVSNCLINKTDLFEMLLDNEKAIENQIRKLPENIDFLMKKPLGENIEISEEEYHKTIKRLKEELLENHDTVVVSLGGNIISYPVFFGTLAADEIILVIEDKPEDIRGMNRFLIEMGKVKDISSSTIFLNSGIDIHESYLHGTMIGSILAVLNQKELQSIRLNLWNSYSGNIKEIDEIVMKLAGTGGKNMAKGGR